MRSALMSYSINLVTSDSIHVRTSFEEAWHRLAVMYLANVLNVDSFDERPAISIFIVFFCNSDTNVINNCYS